jgi:hypothetical protein
MAGSNSNVNPIAPTSDDILAAAFWQDEPMRQYLERFPLERFTPDQRWVIFRRLGDLYTARADLQVALRLSLSKLGRPLYSAEYGGPDE